MNDGTIRFFSYFWGDKHLDMFKNVMFKSLFLPTNIPEMNGRELIFDIYCTGEEKQELKDIKDKIEMMGFGFNLDTEMLSDPNRSAIFKTIKKEMKIAMDDDSLIVMLPPDHVFCNGLSRLIDRLEPLDFVVCGHPRVDYEKALGPLKRIFNDEKTYSIGDNAFFVNLAMKQFPHPMVKFGLNARPPYKYDGKNIVWRGKEEQNYYSIYYNHPPPLCFYPSEKLYNCPKNIISHVFKTMFKDISWESFKQYYYTLKNSRLGFNSIRFNYFDHEYVDIVYHMNHLKPVVDSNEFFWMEFTSNIENLPTNLCNRMTSTTKYLQNLELRWYK